MCFTVFMMDCGAAAVLTVMDTVGVAAVLSATPGGKISSSGLN